MIACYVWTNTQLINALNAKISLYTNEEVTLFVLMIDRISASLLKCIEQLKAFAKIICIDPPPVFKELPTWPRRIRLLLYGKSYQRYFNNYIGQNHYNLLLVGGYWSYAFFVLRAMYNNNTKLRVVLLEEGIGSYYRTRARICQVWPRTCFAELITRYIYFGNFARVAVSLIKHIVVYKPEYVRIKGVPVIAMPPISQNFVFFKQLFKCGFSVKQYQPFIKKQAYMFPMPGSKTEETEQKIWRKLQTYFPHSLYLEHPDESIKGPIPFEVLCTQIDLSDSLLLGFCSSCMLYPKYCFEQEPYVIFTHWIHGPESGLSVSEAQAYAEDLQKSYGNPQKVLIPRCMSDLECVLSNIKLKQV